MQVGKKNAMPLNLLKTVLYRFSDEPPVGNAHGLFKSYSQSSCQFECQLLTALEFCKCIPYNMPRTDAQDAVYPLCDSFGAFCFRNVMENMTNLEEQCKECWPDCNEITKGSN